MKKYTTTIEEITFINHNVLQLKCTKPEGFTFQPGQAVHLFINENNLREQKGAFTMTSLPEEHYLEFVIKVYPSHNGMTDQIQDLKAGDTLEMDSPYGYIHYQNQGLFIAGGSGITPFLCIFKSLAKENKLRGNRLIFANKTEKDIIFKDQLQHWLGQDAIHILSNEKTDAYYHGRIDVEFLKNAIEDFTQDFYLCGPPSMTESLIESLQNLGIEKRQIIAEGFE